MAVCVHTSGLPGFIADTCVNILYSTHAHAHIIFCFVNYPLLKDSFSACCMNVLKFSNKSHNMKALVILSHSSSPFFLLTYLYGENELLWGPMHPYGVFP